MNEERVERMEGLLTQLVSMVGSLKVDMEAMKKDMEDIKFELKEFKETNEREHSEILSKLKDIESDQDHIWEKTVRNERDIAKFKQRN
ncbi:hypothetical protein [Bacillus sp. AK128]